MFFEVWCVCLCVVWCVCALVRACQQTVVYACVHACEHVCVCAYNRSLGTTQLFVVFVVLGPPSGCADFKAPSEL